jgi:SRSO17 transposase
MSPVWAQRREDLMSDCLVSPDVFHQMVDRLCAFVGPYQHVLETETGQRNLPLSLQGLLSHLPGKNAEDMATCVDVERQIIQDFIGPSPWAHRPLLTVVVGHVAERLGEPDGLIAFDPSSVPTRGTHAVGVPRQWCSHRGKVDNCHVGGGMGDVSHHDHAVLDCRLSLPREWTRDEPRRRAGHVPPDVQYQTRQEQCLEMLDLWGAQVPHGWVTGDDALGRHTRWRQELRERGERSVWGVPCTTTLRDLEAPLPAYAGRGRRPKAPWQAVTEGRTSRAPTVWTRLTVRDGEQGPGHLAMVKRRVHTRRERKRLGPEAWLVVPRRPPADDRTWEPRASRDATDQDTRHRYQYDLTPTSVSKEDLKEP